MREMLRNLWPVIVLVVCSLVFSSASHAYLLKDEGSGSSVSIFGMGMVRLNYAWLDGNEELFAADKEGFLEGVDTREFLSLTVNGVVLRDYSLEGEVHYDPVDISDWDFYARLSRDNHYLLLGDQANIFSEQYFTRYSQPFRGLTLHAEGERFGVTTFGAVTRGETEREELTPDGTSGAYDFSNIPVVPESDIVFLEVRNQYDLTEVLETIPQERNVDYTIDYDTGEITFANPMNAETFRGDAVVIVVIYKGLSESSAFRTALIGSRGVVRPVKWLSIGVTHVAEFDRDPGLSEGFDARQEVYGIDSALTLGESWKLSTEYAFSRQHADETAPDDVPQAFRAELRGAVGEQFELQAKYHRTERDFLTFANPGLDPNEQELEMAGVYAYRLNHSLKIGYSFLQDNQPNDAADATTTTHRPYLEWSAHVRDHTELFSKYEYIRATDDQTPKTTDKQTHTWLAGGVQEFLTVPVLSKLTLRGEYQFSDFEDDTNQEPDTLTHQLGLRAASEPVSKILAYVEQRERLVFDKDIEDYTTRQDISEAGVELKRWERFSGASKYQYRVIHDLLQERKTSERHVLTLSSDYQIFTPLNGAGKFELRDETFFAADPDDSRSATRTLNAEGRLTYTPKKDLTARLRYAYEQTRAEADVATTTAEDEAEFRLNYAFDARKTRLTGVVKIERDLTEAPPTPETKTRTITYIAGATREFFDSWDLLVQYKHKQTELTAETESDEFLGEVGYKFGRFLKLTAGYQHSRFADSLESANNYTANSVYFKLIGKL